MCLSNETLLPEKSVEGYKVLFRRPDGELFCGFKINPFTPLPKSVKKHITDYGWHAFRNFADALQARDNGHRGLPSWKRWLGEKHSNGANALMMDLLPFLPQFISMECTFEVARVRLSGTVYQGDMLGALCYRGTIMEILEIISETGQNNRDLPEKVSLPFPRGDR